MALGLGPYVALAALIGSWPAEATPPGPRAQVDPALFQELHWRLVGPFRGGRVLTVSGVPGQPTRFYFGSVNGGVWETGNAGRTWRPVFDGQPVGSIGALAVAPSNPRVLYVGSGEADMRSDIAQGDGVYKTLDGGSSWTKLGLADTQQIGRIIVDPRNQDHVLVAALGHPYGPNPERGVFATTDGGRSWQKVLYKDVDTGAIDVAFEPGNPDVVYAALWQTRRPPWSVYPPSNGPGSGVYKSTDGGRTWTSLAGHGLPAHHGRVGFGLSASRPERVYAIVDASPGGGLYRSDDRGESWTLVSGERRLWGRGWYFGGVTVEPKDPDVVFICNTALYRSADGGHTFVPVKGAPGGDDYHELWIDPQDPERRILGTDQGAVVSVDDGQTWSSWYNQPTAQIYHVTTDQQFPYWLYGAQQDSGALALPSRTNLREGVTLMQFRGLTAGGESDYLAPDPRDPRYVWGGRVDVLDQLTYQTRSVDPTLSHREIDRGTWTLALVRSPRDQRVLYFGRERLFRTDDDGRRWSLISPDLTREDPGVPPNLDSLTAADAPRPGRRHGVIYAIAPSRLRDHELWVGTDDGLVWRSRDEGAHWSDVTPRAVGPWSKVGMVETSFFDPDTVYLAVDRHRLDDRRPYVYRTHDGGRTWEPATAGIPEGSFVNAVREDPVRRGLLYAGTERGVYVSFDEGDGWQPLQLDLPVTSVRDLDVHGHDLVIATHGRGFWILDDVSPLRQLGTEVAQAGAWLFTPEPAARLRPAGFTGTPLPLDEPMAANPPEGAVIDYVVGSGVSGPVEIAVLDGQRALVRRFSSGQSPIAPDLSRIHVAPEWVPQGPVVSGAPGHHRLVWSLRYPPPAGLATRENDVDGIWATPGPYTVQLTVGETTVRRPLTVRPDPRIDLPPAVYARQFTLAKRLEPLRVRVREAIDAADALQPKLAATQGAGELEREVQALAGPQWGAASLTAPPAGLITLRGLESWLDALDTAVEGADADPGPEVDEGIALAERTAQAVLSAWDALAARAHYVLNR